jgi:hypothetical protein
MKLRLYFSVALLIFVSVEAFGQVVLWDTGPPKMVNFNGADTYVGYSSGDLGAGLEQRWAAIPFRIDFPNAVITRMVIDWFVVVGSEADRVNYIIWNRNGLSAPVDGEQFSSGVLGAYGVGIDDPRVPEVEDWLHQYDVNIPIPEGDYYLTIYGDGGTVPNNAAWLTGANLQDEALEQNFMWRSAMFPVPGFVVYNPANVLPIGDQDPDDRWNPSFTLYGTISGDEATFPPDSFFRFRGVFVSGDLNSLLASDNNKLCHNPGITLFPSEAPITLDFFGISPNDAPDALSVTIESSANTVGLGLTFRFWNFHNAMWQTVGTASQSNNVDTVRTYPGVPNDHIQGGTGQVRTRYEVRKVGFVFLFPWTDCVDHVFWKVVKSSGNPDDWLPIPVDFGSNKTVAYDQLGEYLYAGTIAAGGGTVWQSPDGILWYQVSNPGFGDPNNISVSPASEFNGEVYAGTTNDETGGQVWRSPDAGATWLPANPGGFGDPNNLTVTPNEVFNGQIYAGTDNQTNGGQLWRSIDGVNWVQVANNGFGDPNTVQIQPTLVSGGFLYVAATNLVTGGQIWRSADGVNWTQVNVDGFGNPNNISAIPRGVYGGQIYAGTANLTTGGEIWRSPNGTTWTQVVAGGFGDSNNSVMFVSEVFAGRLFAGTYNSVTGGEVWSSLDGSNWTQSNIDGFGDPASVLTIPTAVFNSLLFTSVHNESSGGQLWTLSDP